MNGALELWLSSAPNRSQVVTYRKGHSEVKLKCGARIVAIGFGDSIAEATSNAINAAMEAAYAKAQGRKL